MAAGGMHEVELADDPAGPGPDDRADRSRAARRTRLLRVLRRWWPLAAGVLTAVVVAQVVADRRHDTAVEHRRETDGVLQTTVSPPLTAVRWGLPDAWTLATSGVPTVDGLVAGVVTPSDGGAPVFVAADPRTGEEAWRVGLGPETEVPAPGSCTAAETLARTVWCLVPETVGRDGDASARQSRLVEVGIEERAVLGSRVLPTGSGFAVAGSTLVVVTPDGTGTVAEATGTATDDVLWTTRVDGVTYSLDQGMGVVVAGDRLIVSDAATSWVLDTASGESVELSGWAQPTRVGRVAVTQGSTSTRLLAGSGADESEVQGVVVPVETDDGSAPGVLLVQRLDGTPDGLLAAVDTRTGRTLWERAVHRVAYAPVVVLDGVVYGDGGTSVWALDLLTGEERWSTPAQLGETASSFTDGESLLRTERDPVTGALALTAYDLGDGHRAWTAPLPVGITSVSARTGTPFGLDAEGLVSTIG